jgi:hypothetical protein
VFQKLKNKEKGDGVGIVLENGTKVWEVKKEYDETEFPDTSKSLGYKIDVYQESINKMIPEYLVNYDYLNRVMENYGFQLVAREEAASLGIPEASGLFSELFETMVNQIKTKKYKASEYGSALKMEEYEKNISFLNRYFVYKKVRNVNAQKVVIEDEDAEDADAIKKQKEKQKEKQADVSLEKSVQKTKKETKPKVKKLNTTLVLAQDSATSEVVEDKDKKEDKKEENKQETKPAKKAKRVKLIIQEE